MAVEYNQFESEDERRRREEAESQSGQTQSPSENGVIAGSSEPAAKKSTGSGSWTNLESYMEANKPQAFGQKVAGLVDSDIDSARNQQAASATGFKKQVDDNTTNFDNEFVTGTVANAGSTALSDADKLKFKKQKDAEFKGPGQLADTDAYTDAYKKTQKASDVVKSSKTEPGRFALLDNYFARPTYGRGEKALDNLLVQNDEGSREAFGAVQEKGKNLNPEFDTYLKSLGDYSAAGKATTAGTRASTRASLGIDEAGNLTNESGAIKSLNEAVDSKVTARGQKRDKDVSDINTALTSRDLRGLSPEMLASLGIDGVDGLYGVNANSYLTGNTNINRNTVASPAEQARAAALSELAGLENSFLPDASLAGTADDEQTYAFDGAGFKTAISGAKGDVDRATSAHATRTAGIQNSINTWQNMITNLNNGVGSRQSPDDIVTDKATGMTGSYNDIWRYYMNQLDAANSEFSQYMAGTGADDRFRRS